ncbi:MAG: YvcK family protein [bacterium]|nr:YvcK family protein [bacterium]
MKKIVCFGGGKAMPKVILSELKKHPFKITSITSMLDSGGSTGKLVKEYGILPMGDIRRHLLVFSEQNQEIKDLFAFRFKTGEFAGHSFGNLFILAEYLRQKDFIRAIKNVSDFLKIKENCECLPAILEKTNLFAELENGKIIKGEDEIDVPKKHNGNLKIKRIFVKPMVKTNPVVLKRTKEADLIILGPGDLYSSVLACFLPQGIKEAIKETTAKILFICPIMEKFGETNNFSVLDFSKEVEKYLGKKLDFVLYNNKIILKNKLKIHKKTEPQLLGQVKVDKNLDKARFVGKDLVLIKEPIFHEPKKTIKEILKFI